MMLKTENLSRTFCSKKRKNRVSKTILDGLSFEADSGELVLIKGKSGAGKSVLFSLLAGIDKPDSGKIIINGRNISDAGSSELAEIRAGQIKLVFQNHNLIESWNIMENLMAADLRPLPKKEKAEQAAELLKQFGMEDCSSSYPSELSMGQQMRITIARSLMVRPLLLLADEPTGELDSESAELTAGYLKKLCREEKICIIAASHGCFPEKFADRILVLENGNLKKQ
jgi:putative ABC transport system ATP-binding protein